MDKRALQTYAVWAKGTLENQIEISLKVLGVNSETDIKNSSVMGDYTVIEGDSRSYAKDLNAKRTSIVELIRREGYKQTIEQFAYTWFNRLIALRFMEIHDYIPHGFRVLSSRDKGQIEPEILKNLPLVKDDLKLDFELCSELKNSGRIEELFRYVLFRQCKALSGILPMLFSEESDYLELLLPQTLLKGDTVITKLVEIDESNFLSDVEVIGWLYQFYVSSQREEFRQAKLINKELIPTLTQVFTPDWIVRYMAENSIGRIWLESYPASQLKSDMKYYVDNVEQTKEVQSQLDRIKYKNVSPEDIKIMEPCCGSGHILVYAFDLLQKMYEEKGYQKREISSLILKNNLIGLDIDKRAAQLANFSLVMKARKVNARFFSKEYFVAPKVYEIKDSKSLINLGYKQKLQELGGVSNDIIEQVEYIVDTFEQAKTIGSLLKVKNINYDTLAEQIISIKVNAVSNLFNLDFINIGIPLLLKLINLAKILSNKYDVMITNPPYLGISKMEQVVKDYASAFYADSKSDMFAMFMEVPLVKRNGYRAMVNPDSWMFLVSYEELRKKIIANENIVNMIHLGLGAFDATVQTTSFVLRNSKISGNGVYFRLVNSKDKEQDFVDNLNKCSGGGYSL